MPDETGDQEKLTPNPEHLAKLKEGVEAWNAWREENPGIYPELWGAHLGQADLQEINLLGAHLQGAILLGAKLQKAILSAAHLEGADLRMARLRKAHLDGARLQGAFLSSARLQKANLFDARLEGADLRHARLQKADFTVADLRNADLSATRVDNTIFDDVAWRLHDGSEPDPSLYEGFDVRGIRYSDPLFDRFVRQSEFIRCCRETWPKPVFWVWKLTCNCGRSLWRWVFSCGVLVLLFGYWFLRSRLSGHPLVELRGRDPTMLSDIYFSVVTFSTLGFGDVTPCNWVGELVVMAEVFLGYVFLGGAISIFTTKFIPPQ